MVEFYNYLKDLSDWQQFIIAVVVTLLAAKIVESVIIAGCRRLAARTTTRIDDALIRALQGPLFHSVVFSGAALIIIVASFPPSVELFVLTLLKMTLLLLWTKFLITAGPILIRAAGASQKVSMVTPATTPLFQNLFVIIVVVFAVYLAFSLWGVNMTAWLASAGIIGIAIGFAAKDTLANLFAGIFILTDMPYKVGDYIVLDSGERGKVVHVGIRSTRIMTRGDVEITIPNAVMGNATIINESGGPAEQYRITIALSVAYDSDIDYVEKVLLDVAATEELLVSTPAPRVRFRAFGASGLEVNLLGWIERPEQRGRVTHQLNCAILKRFRSENITIPFPQYDVHIKNASQEVHREGSSDAQ